MRGVRSRLCAALLLAGAASIGSPYDARAQDLAQIDTLVAHGRLTDAREALAQWREQNASGARSATGDEQAHALMLGGRLSADATAAEQAYLALVLGHPTSAFASAALLRLGQSLLATGEPERARGYLERLVRDYPNTPLRAEALLWLARAQRAVGRDSEACATLRDARALRATAPETAELLQHEESLACARVEDVADAPYAVQAGAFRTEESAARYVRDLAARGFEGARVVFVPTSTRACVRFGRFRHRADAAAFMQHLRDAGFDAAVVDDARSERTHP